MHDKRIAIALGAFAALFTLSLVTRFVFLSEYGFSGGWMYLGLPFGGIGVAVLLLRLGLIDVGRRSQVTAPSWPFGLGNGGAFPPAPAPQGLTVAQRLQELENMRASGAISESEYNTKREHIIAGV